MRLVKWIALATLVPSGSSTAISARQSNVDAVKNLDLTTFPTSVGPRRVPGKVTFADCSVVTIKKSAKGAEIIRDDKGWKMSFTVLSGEMQFLHLCFYDTGLGQPDGVSVTSYNSTSALLVTKSREGRWNAKQVPESFASCQDDPAVA